LGTIRLQCSDELLLAAVFSTEAGVSSDEHPILSLCSAQLEEYFNGGRKAFDLPLGQVGTGFQMKVWDLLCNIPFGRTLTYQELSKQYGDPKSIRAVAAANGRNKLAIIIPCHRVIGSNQSLTGYAGGLWRKKWLLDREAKHHHGVQSLFG
jgi:methylated-DNA-[protein]-cysteine S-methyltransferase